MHEDTTRRAIRRMLRENTGSHLLDSGAIYGYQYNRRIDRRTFIPSVRHGRTEYHLLNTAHYLAATLAYDVAMNRRFRAFSRSMPRDTWEAPLTAFCERDGLQVINSGNTYNYDTSLSRDFAYWAIAPGLTSDDAEAAFADSSGYVVIRSHNGCDARGGYASPRWFTPYGDDAAYDWLYGGPSTRLDYYCQTCGDGAPADSRLIREGARCSRCHGIAYVGAPELEL